MGFDLKAVEALDLWRGAIVESVRREAPDLSARQMALLLTVYLTSPPHTVRGLAAALNISKPAITRALDRLSDYGLVRRKVDETDRRSVLIQRTVKGSVFLREFGDIIVAAAAVTDGEASGS
jgi:DNA-binding MarR family transcriptional regulator